MDMKEMTPKKVRDAWEQGIKSTRVEREQASVNGAFIRNRQWVYWNRAAGRLEELPRSPQRVRASVPRIGPDTRRIMAKLVRRGLQFEVPPSSPDDASMKASRTAEAALAETHLRQAWETKRLDHANCVWEAGVAGICVEWDHRVGPEVAQDDAGQPIATGDVKLTVVSVHEICFDPGTRDGEHARWWVRGQALPPAEVQDMFDLEKEPAADARAVETIWRLADRSERGENIPLTMVLTYYERPTRGREGRVMTVVGEQVVEDAPWTFPFTDRLNISLAVVEPIHGVWTGHTPVTDAVPVQAILNASWSSIVEHIKLAGNARLWVPMGSVDDVEEITDTAGEAVEYNPINGLSPKYESPPSMPDWWIRQPGMLGDALDDIMSVHDISRGQAPSGVESGIALSILSENDDTPVGSFAKALGECWGRVASMVLELWAANVKESRESMVRMPTGIPEVVKWNGQDLEQRTAVVPLDSVMPRSRAAQAAYAMQLYDRGIITTPWELAKVADLPDQDDLLAGIDPDTARAQRENYWMATGAARTIAVIDDHANHIKLHRDFARSERFENMKPEFQEIVELHLLAHELYAAQQAAQQVQAAGISPAAAMLPTKATQVLPSESMADAAALQAAAPGGPSIPAELIPEADMSAPPPQQQPGIQPASEEQEDAS
jgi:hypothetical protein